MALPNRYTLKPNSVQAYFDAMLDAEAPDRFSQKFLETLEFKSTNDRTFIGVLKELSFLDADGVPTERYYKFLDRSRSGHVVAEGVRDAFSDLFAVSKNAEKLSPDEVKNKLRTLYQGKKKENLIYRIAATFGALCEYADFTTPLPADSDATPGARTDMPTTETSSTDPPREDHVLANPLGTSPLSTLQYHINITLPDTRDAAVFDAIFKSLKQHLGE